MTPQKSNFSLARAGRQGILLDVPPVYTIKNNANARNAFGAAAQDIVCAALGLDGIPIDGSKDICFDAEGAVDEFWEIKSVRQGGKVVLYDWRMKKEKDSGHRLFYAILMHKVHGFRDGATLVNEISLRKPRILVCPAQKVHDLAFQEPLHTIKEVEKAPDAPRMGYDRAGYKEGYRNLSVKKLVSLGGPTIRLTFSVHGVTFKEVSTLIVS